MVVRRWQLDCGTRVSQASIPTELLTQIEGRIGPRMLQGRHHAWVPTERSEEGHVGSEAGKRIVAIFDPVCSRMRAC